MLKYAGIHIIGLVLSVGLLLHVFNYINTGILHADLMSVQPNDKFQLLLRIFVSYIFGAAYFYFKLTRVKYIPSSRQIILSAMGLIILLIVIDFVQVFVTINLLSRPHIFVHRILPLWLSYPCIILCFGLFQRYLLKRD